MTSPASNEKTQGSVLSVFKNKNFLHVWIASLISNSGDRINNMAVMGLAGMVALQAGYESGTDAYATYVTHITTTNGIFFLIPFILLAPFGGVMVDRWNRKRILIYMDVFRGVLVCFMPLIPYFNLPIQWTYLVSFLLGAASGVFSPAKHAVIPEILPKKDLLIANAMYASTGVVFTLLGTVVGGALIDMKSQSTAGIPATGLELAFALDSLTFIVSAVFISFAVIAFKPKTKTLTMAQAGKEFWNGAKYMRRKKAVRQFVALSCLFWFLGGLIMTGVTYVGASSQDSGSTVAVMVVALAVGMIAGVAVLRFIENRIRGRFPLHWSCFALTVIIALVGNAKSLNGALGLLFLLGVGGVTLQAPVEAALQKLLPNSVRGRVFGVQAALTMAAFLIGQEGANLLLGSLPSFGILCSLTAIIMLCASFWVAFGSGFFAYDVHTSGRRIFKPIMKLFFRFEYNAAPKTPEGRPVIVVANHSSYLDALGLSLSFPGKVRWMVTHEFYDSKLFGFFLRAGGCIRVRGGGSNKDALKAGLDCLNRREILGLFPEGRLSADGKLAGKVENGVAYMALKTNAVIVTAAYHGAFEAYPKGKKFPRLFGKVKLRYGRIIDPKIIAGDVEGKEGIEKVMRVVMEEIQTLMNDLAGSANSAQASELEA